MNRTFLTAAVLVTACPMVACSSQVASRSGLGNRPSLVLLTLDTTRADALGSYGAAEARTPVLDELAGRGTRYARALAPSPLTLPAHASLLTGLDPPLHGLLDNGTAALHPSLPTLATILSEEGYSCGAFVASRVLDRRFGLNRGFEVYDDFMAAEEVGEYGYPERDAASVTSAALDWIRQTDLSQPSFLWAHYYDPHAPYFPPPEWRGDTEDENYAGEVAYMDREIGRLLEAVRSLQENIIVAVVGDHGESLGEHGEKRHGIFLYGASLEVPLILAGPGVPSGQVVEEVVGTRRLMGTLLALLDVPAGDGREAGLPGLPAVFAAVSPEPVYSSTWMPANTYGWSPLRAASDQRWRLILAPRSELYDLGVDPAETDNQFDQHPEEVLRLKSWLSGVEEKGTLKRATPPQPAVDPRLQAALGSLGYLTTSALPDSSESTIDPKDGILMLAESDKALQLMESGQTGEAHEILEKLVTQNPRNVPFRSRLARVQLLRGEKEAALQSYRIAIDLSPNLDFLHLNLARALRQLGHLQQAARAYRKALELNPGSASAWLGLAELASLAGDSEKERSLLEEALQVGTRSVLLRCRLGQITAAQGNPLGADLHFQAATGLAPDRAFPWLLWGEAAEASGQIAEALQRYSQAAFIEPNSPEPLLKLGRLHSERGDLAQAQRYLRQVLSTAPDSEEAEEARRLLHSLGR